MKRIKWVVDAVVGFGRTVLSSESGVVNPRRGFLVAWTVGTLVAVSVFVGAPADARDPTCQVGFHYFENYCEALCQDHCWMSGYCNRWFCYTEKACMCWYEE